jgi:biotin carboxyl carrier protein
MKYLVRLLAAPGTGEAAAVKGLEVELPPLRAGEPVRARVDGREVEVMLLAETDGEPVLSIDGRRFPLRPLPAPPEAHLEVRFLHRGWPVAARVESEVDRLRAGAARRVPGGGPYTVTSPLPGVVRRVLASPGEEVEARTPLLTLEAMKMENEVPAGRAGRIAEVFVAAGQVVNAGDPLARILC